MRSASTASARRTDSSLMRAWVATHDGETIRAPYDLRLEIGCAQPRELVLQCEIRVFVRPRLEKRLCFRAPIAALEMREPGSAIVQHFACGHVIGADEYAVRVQRTRTSLIQLLLCGGRRDVMQRNAGDDGVAR